MTKVFSGMAAMHALLREEMAQFYATNGKYPNTLAELSLEGQWDGADKSWLTNFTYFSAGYTFSVEWNHPRLATHRHRMRGAGGKLIEDSFGGNADLHSIRQP
jgi:hypothetical protein